MKYVVDSVNLTDSSSSSSEEEEGEVERRRKRSTEKTTAAPASAYRGNLFILSAVETKTFTEGYATLVAEIQVADLVVSPNLASVSTKSIGKFPHRENIFANFPLTVLIISKDTSLLKIK